MLAEQLGELPFGRVEGKIPYEDALTHQIPPMML
jgi:hypothetical protein